MFETELVLKPGAINQWLLDEPLVYVTKSGAVIKVPMGFETDLASIPRLATLLIPINGSHRAASVIHDYLYHTKIVTRKEADAIFREAMQACGTMAPVRWAMWAAVRIGGWVPWST